MDKQFPLNKIDKLNLLHFKDKVASYSYTEEEICNKLDVKNIYDISLDYYPIYIDCVLKEYEPLDTLILLFLLQQEVPLQVANALFFREEIDFLEAIQVLRIDYVNNKVKSLVDIYPCRDLYFATDRRYFKKEIKGYSSKQPVMYLGADSYCLSRATLRDQVDYTLDLCTGCGVQAILASEHSKKVIGVDINPRAINFSKFNALLNGVENVVFLLGDTYSPVTKFEKFKKFDLITANPPFVASPGIELLYRDGGRCGEMVLKKIVSGLSEFLERGGTCHIVVDMVKQEGVQYEEKLKNWLSNEVYDILTLEIYTRDIYSYAIGHAKCNFDIKFRDYKVDLTNLINLYKDNRIEKFDFGIINIRKRLPSTKGWFVDKMVNLPTETLQNAIKGFFKTKCQIEDETFDANILKQIPLLSPYLVMTVNYQHNRGNGFLPREIYLNLENSIFNAKSQITEGVMELLELCNGENDILSIITSYAKQCDCSYQDIEEECLSCFKDMIEKGYIIFSKGDKDCSP